MSCVFFLTTFLTAAFGLIINETKADPPSSKTFKHMTAQFGVQSGDHAYRTIAPLVAVNPANGCENIENKDELNGTIALVKFEGSCQFIIKAKNVEKYGSVGMVVGNKDNTLMWMTQPGSVNIHIPCVLVTQDTYVKAIEKLAKQQAESVIATISTDGLVPPPNLWTFPSLMEIVTYFLIVFPVVWAILAIKHFWWRNRQNRREQRRRRIKSQDIPEVLFTKDLLDDSDVEVPIRRRKTHLTNNSCPICLENFEEQIKIKLLSCEHGFHSECIGPWIAEHNDSCPICRQTITVKEEDNELHSKCRCCCCQCPFWRVRPQEELNQSLLVLDAENEHQVAEVTVEENDGLQDDNIFQQEEEQKKGNLVSLQSFEEPVQADSVDVSIEESKTGEVS